MVLASQNNNHENRSSLYGSRKDLRIVGKAPKKSMPILMPNVRWDDRYTTHNIKPIATPSKQTKSNFVQLPSPNLNEINAVQNGPIK
jgi:hypothetical protein